ncbi:MAG TPA: hypothetical protein VMZ53_11065 [Kofleriaceae bacterium]|nr:hypothetical protein [Kofleriaceae bacterium]
MKRLGMVAAALVGCTNGGSPASPDAAGVQPDAPALAPAVPGACHESITLYGLDGTNGRKTVGPLALDTQGVTLCLTLDATQNIVVGHFGADSGREQAAASTFAMSLFDANGTLLRDGWDVTFGSSPPTTFANLEYGVTKGTILEAKLVIRTRAGQASTSVGLDLIEPYE